MPFLAWLETTGLSVWIRETPSLWGFPFILFLHTLGLAMLAGINTAYMIWLIRYGHEWPSTPLDRYFPVMWLGLLINAVSGLLLLIAYPAKALTNPVFYAKLIAITIALALTGSIRRQTRLLTPLNGATGIDVRLRYAAIATIVLWLVATGTGRFLAYTHSVLMATEPGFY